MRKKHDSSQQGRQSKQKSEAGASAFYEEKRKS